eukprot:scaffold119046_cov29-Attheya_sp.AAC.1
MEKSDEIKSLKEKTMFVSLRRQCSRDISTAGRTSNNTCVTSSISPRQVLEQKALTTLFVAAGIWKPDERKLRDPFWGISRMCQNDIRKNAHGRSG